MISEKDIDIFNDYGTWGHKMLGHPYFIQGEFKEDKDDILLLQIDSAVPEFGAMDENNSILFGDAGVCRFFIPPDNLKKTGFFSCFLRLGLLLTINKKNSLYV